MFSDILNFLAYLILSTYATLQLVASLSHVKRGLKNLKLIDAIPIKIDWSTSGAQPVIVSSVIMYAITLILQLGLISTAELKAIGALVPIWNFMYLGWLALNFKSVTRGFMQPKWLTIIVLAKEIVAVLYMSYWLIYQVTMAITNLLQN